jgi:hypothetical protein
VIVSRSSLHEPKRVPDAKVLDVDVHFQAARAAA